MALSGICLKQNEMENKKELVKLTEDAEKKRIKVVDKGTVSKINQNIKIKF